MTDHEVMQMALDALLTWKTMHPHTTANAVRTPAIEALRAALAQGEQEPMAFLADATRFKVTLTERDCKITNLPRELGGRWVALVAAENDSHLKLTAPPQEQWKKLTSEDIHEVIINNPELQPMLMLDTELVAKLCSHIDSYLRIKNS